MIHKHHSGDKTTTEIQNQKSWKLKQAPSLSPTSSESLSWMKSLCFQSNCLFLSFFLFKRRSTQNSCAQSRKFEENFGLHSISTFLCGATSALALAGDLFLYTHSAFIHLMRAPVLWELASLGLDRTRSTGLLHVGCGTQVIFWPLVHVGLSLWSNLLSS